MGKFKCFDDNIYSFSGLVGFLDFVQRAIF
jgi:hypothetical protein